MLTTALVSPLTQAGAVTVGETSALGRSIGPWLLLVHSSPLMVNVGGRNRKCACDKLKNYRH